MKDARYMCYNKKIVKRNIKALLCNHCCSGKEIIITYFECVLLALDIQIAVRMRHIVICGLPGSARFFHIISYTARLSKQQLQNMKGMF